LAVSTKLKVAGGVVGSFLLLAFIVFYLTLRGTLSPQQGGLMVVALFGLYVGFGILIAVYRLISKLD